MGIFSFVKPGKQIFKTITSVKPNVPKTKLEKARSKLAIATQKSKAARAKLDNTIFGIKQQKKRDKKMGGGMMGRRMGYSEGKLAETPREKRLAAQYGDKKRITRGDIITIAKKKSGEEPMRDRMKQPLKRKKP